MDIIDVSPDDLVLPGDCLGGAIGLGRIGPFDECGGPWFPAAGRADPYGEMWCEEHGSRCSDSAPLAIYDCRDEWLRDRLRRVLAAGERCDDCMGYLGDEDGQCAACMPGSDGTGYTRQPHDLGWIIDAEIGGRITPLVAAGLMWASVLRVEAGLGPVAGWDYAYENNTDACSVDRWCDARAWWTRDDAQRDYFTAPSGVGHLGWEWGTWRGMETGKAAADCMNRAALSTGFALLNADHILLPRDGGKVARLRLEG